VTESDRRAQLVAFKLRSSITIGGERKRQREWGGGIVKDGSNTKFGTSFMWTAKRSYIAHRTTAASHPKLALMGFLAEVIPIKKRVIPFFQRPLQSQAGHHCPYLMVVGTRNSHEIYDTLSTNILQKLTELQIYFPCCAALSQRKSMYQLGCFISHNNKIQIASGSAYW
jgi:hypothetical protein